MRAPSAGAALEQWLAYQEQLHPRAIELGLERVGAVARRLGLLPSETPTLTIAGTNGKGSSATLAASIYRHAGYTVGLYTSPHLLRYNERIAIDDRLASDESLCAAFAAIEQARGEIPLTYFEFGTLAALWLFRGQRVQVQVLEVGLGGRLDAVNLVDADAALVTSIGLDHTDWLGPDRESIAAEKAAVFRRDRPAICADPDPPRAIAATAHGLGARLLQIDHAFSIQVGAAAWDWSDRVDPLQSLRGLPLPAMPGAAQIRNAAGVIAMVQSLQHRLPVPRTVIEQALRSWRIPGRFDVRGNVVFDVAHNVEAAQVLADNLKLRFPRRPVHVVLGMLSDKPCAEFHAGLAARIATLHLVSLPGPRGLSAEALQARIGPAAFGAAQYAEVGLALEGARAQAQADDLILVTGSFLTVAAGLAHG